jgi:hypothetical protein
MNDDFYAAVKGLRLRLIAEVSQLDEPKSDLWGTIYVDTFKNFGLSEAMLATLGKSTAYAISA